MQKIKTSSDANPRKRIPNAIEQLIRDDLIYGYLYITLNNFMQKFKTTVTKKHFQIHVRKPTKESQVQLQQIREHVTSVIKPFFNSRWNALDSTT